MLFTLGQFLILAVVLIAGFLLGFASRPSTRKWRERVRDQADSFTAYHDDAEDRIRAAQQRARALENEAAALRADRADAERTIAALTAAPPEPAPPAPPEPARPALALVPVPEHAPEPEPEPVAEATVEEDTPAPATDTAEPPETHASTIAPAPVELAETVTPAPAPVAQSAARPAFGVPLGDAAPSESAEPLAMTPTPSAGAPAPIGPAEPEMPARGWFGDSARDDLTRIRGIDGVLNTRLFGLGVLRFEDVEKLSAEDEMALEQRLALPVGTVARDQWRAQAALLRAGHDEDHAERFGAVPAEA